MKITQPEKLKVMSRGLLQAVRSTKLSERLLIVLMLLNLMWTYKTMEFAEEASSDASSAAYNADKAADYASDAVDKCRNR